MSSFNNLGRDEEVVFQAKMHWARLIIPGLIALLFVVGGCSSDESAGGIAIILGLIILIPAVIPMLTTKLTITSKRVYGKVGLIRTKTLDTPLNKVNTVSVSSGLMGKIFRYGTIFITSSSGVYKFNGIKDADLVRQTLMEQIDRFDEERIRKQAAEMARAIRG